ncbi:efflux RND transporter periplasmic adaptor subunit [Maribellus comscasis]|jgi:Cu(I)/Ag(I) efflux system membrane fusion protein|uniref:Efflux RND transporter periplasmic adaptor subunit n=1 Tax=Maribellus comscasis TaxID=2681766 RepID=A0A6I6K740_9BACT|nr:efflux RND transporter periplasmic adaptor subunit [Maribellus comscasis]MDD4227398.1 efflux RND transporter periplasmic adaptor subunit [Mariniphaga sp.]QGY45824.1 efflux RND transporter periplasmic adaptor subunit [Maribellus comscasis]
MKTNRKTIIIAVSTLAVGLLLGWLIFGGSESKTTEEQQHEHIAEEVAGETIWTCSMHPQIRQNEPGDCPICGMDLIPLEDEQNSGVDPMAISMSSTAMQLANISTAIVGSMDPVKQVRLNGKVQSDERLVYSQSSHIPGRVENLMVNFTGDYVQKGQVIASVYSPDLVTAQEELFEAQKIKESQPQLFNAAKEKLKNWKLTDSQIEQILNYETAKETFDVQADISGYVTQKMVNPGDYVGRGQAIYEIADLSKVWVLFDVYESDMPWVKKGDKVDFSIASLPGETFSGAITFLDPVIDSKTRVAKARVEVVNRGLKLKPEMFASGKVEAKLPNRSGAVVVPKTAVMWTGERSVVYLKSKTDQGVNFMMREVELGPALGESFIVENGLEEGEEIAVNGTFSIDAAAQLAGKPSMMNPAGGPAMTGHNHGGMDMGGASAPPVEPVDADPKFTAQLTDVYEAYLDMKNAFVETDAQKVNSGAQKVSTALNSVDMGLLKGDAHMAWMDQLNALESAVNAINKSDDIEKQRREFARFNLAFYKSLKMFGLDNETAYYQYCPMANRDKGAYWLSEIKEIRNPYFGEDMLGCGETRETLK